MKPKTKMEKYVANLELKDPKINMDKIFKKVGYFTKTKVNCMQCGAICEATNHNGKTFTCTNCNLKLKLVSTRKRTLNESKYIEVVEAVGDVQITRMFFAIRECKVGKEEMKMLVEAYRWFIPPKGRNILMSIATSTFFYEWRWVLNSELEIRRPNFNSRYNLASDKYYINPDIVLIKSFNKRFKYCGYKKQCNVSAYRYLECYQIYPQVELLSKFKYYDLLRWLIYHNKLSLLELYKKAFRTVFKYNYIISDYSIYLDYLDLLTYFNKDISNYKYACPNDLNKAHDKLVNKKILIIHKPDNDKYIKRMKKFQNIEFGNEKISIVAFKDLAEIRHEGNVLHHCVFKNEYYKKKNSLLLSARINGNPIATIELYLDRLIISQIRGLKNSTPIEYEEIKKLVEKNVIPFVKRLKKAA